MDKRLTVNSPINMSAGSLRRGFSEVCILLDREEDVLPPEELIFAYRDRRVQLDEQRKQVYLAMGSPSRQNLSKWKGRPHKCKTVKDTNLLSLYLDIGDKLTAIQADLKKINKVTREGVPLTFSLIFMGVAREMIDETTYQKIHEKCQELEQQGFLGTNEDWAKFVASLD